MILTYIKIQGTEYPACMSTRVLTRMEEEGISLEAAQEGANVTTLFKLVSYMLDAGQRYCKKNGIPAPEAISIDDLMDLTGPDDYESMLSGVQEAANVKDRKVEAEPPKNAEAAGR